MKLETIRIRNIKLRPIELFDMEDLALCEKDSPNHRNTKSLYIPKDEGNAKKWMGKYNTGLNEIPPYSAVFVIEIEKKPAGAIGLFNIKDNEAEIGYFLSRDYCGKRVSVGSVRAITKFGLQTLGLKQIYARALRGDAKETALGVLIDAGYNKQIINDEEILFSKGHK